PSHSWRLNPFLLLFSVSSIPPPPTDTSPLSLHDALPIYAQLRKEFRLFLRLHLGNFLLNGRGDHQHFRMLCLGNGLHPVQAGNLDRKSTRLNSSHVSISYAVLCLKKKNSNIEHHSIVTRI